MKFVLTRNVTKKECPWLDKGFKKGDEVYRYDGPTYGVISFGGIACTLEDGKIPFFELPTDAIEHSK